MVARFDLNGGLHQEWLTIVEEVIDAMRHGWTFIGTSLCSDPSAPSPYLLDQDVCVACVAGDLCDETEVDEAQAHCTDKAVVGGVVEAVPGGDVIGDRACGLVFGHDFGQSFAIADVEARVTPDGLAGAVVSVPAGQGALKPNPFRCSAMLYQGERCGQRRHQAHAGLSVG